MKIDRWSVLVFSSVVLRVLSSGNLTLQAYRDSTSDTGSNGKSAEFRLELDGARRRISGGSRNSGTGDAVVLHNETCRAGTRRYESGTLGGVVSVCLGRNAQLIGPTTTTEHFADDGSEACMLFPCPDL